MNRTHSRNGRGKKFARPKVKVWVAPYVHGPPPVEAPFKRRKCCMGIPAFRLLTDTGIRVESLIAAHAIGEPLPVEYVTSNDLDEGDVIVVVAGEIIPADEEIISGVALVDESAITGESVAVIRGGGGDRSTLTRGTRVVSNYVVVRVTEILR